MGVFNDTKAVKVGMKVRCVRPASPLRQDEEYTVTSIRSCGNEIYVRDSSDIAIGGSWLCNRFEPVEPKPVADVRPPLGLRPRHIVDCDRLVEILEAMFRYAQAGKAVPEEWTMELSELQQRQRSTAKPILDL